MSEANDIQIDGNHYKELSIQVWDYIAANKLDYFQGNAIKYITRFREKGGIKDLEKAKHYIDKLIEIERVKQSSDNTQLMKAHFDFVKRSYNSNRNTSNGNSD